MSTGMLAARSEPITVAEWLESEDAPEYSELYQGMLVVPARPDGEHQLLVSALSCTFPPNAQTGITLTRGATVGLGADTAFQPDVLYLGPERTHLLRRRMVDGPPDIVVEVSSPGTRRYDLTTKLPTYLVAGVREGWIVDPVAKTVSVYEPGLPEPRVAAFGERIPSMVVDVGSAGLERLPEVPE